jgi:uncharacterized lipoprotein NlpE involved in copper resistance
MKKVLFAGAVLLVFCVWSCAKQPERAAAPADSFDDIEGEYRGVLPCADCEGIETVVRLRRDGTYTLQMHYLGESDEVFEWEGTFTFNRQTQRLVLGGEDKYHFPELYAVGKNTLTHLDANGDFITGELADLYILKKQ